MQAGYLELKLSWELFRKAPETLSEPERHRLSEVARQQDSIEQRILASTAAANVVVPEATLATRIAEISQRYPSADEFALDLERSGLDKTCLRRLSNVICALKACSKKSPPAPPRSLPSMPKSTTACTRKPSTGRKPGACAIS
jgi:hypothetical protein